MDDNTEDDFDHDNDDDDTDHDGGYDNITYCSSHQAAPAGLHY